MQEIIFHVRKGVDFSAVVAVEEKILLSVPMCCQLYLNTLWVIQKIEIQKLENAVSRNFAFPYGKKKKKKKKLF